MRLKDWDTPGEGNGRLCETFTYRSFEYGARQMPYREFIPKTSGQDVPLVLYLHGADAVGTDNEKPLAMHDIGTVFAREDWQKRHPCYILAPQYPSGSHWTNASMRETAQALVEAKTAEYPDIDERRLYIYGYSAGAVGLLAILKAYPRVYAGAVAICGSTEQEGIERLRDTPLWMFHAADDAIVGAGARKLPFYHTVLYGSHALYESMKGTPGRDLHYTEYPAGMMQERYHVNPHCSWVPAAEDGEAKEWLFAQERAENKSVLPKKSYGHQEEGHDIHKY